MKMQAESAALIGALYESTPACDNSSELILERLLQLERHNSGEFCSWLLPLTLCEHPRVARAVRKTIAAYLEQKRPGLLKQVSQGCRPSYGREGLSLQRYFALKPKDIPEILGPEAISQHLVGFLSFHPSGYFREQACHLLKPNQGGLPYLLLRLNDWVLQVREAAQKQLTGNFHLVSCQEWVRVFALVLRLKKCARYDHTGFVATVEESLQQSEAIPAITAGLESPEKEVRRACYGLALDQPMDKERLLLKALKSGDLVVRCWALSRYREQLPTPCARSRYLQQALKNRSQRVRQLALTESVDLFPADQTPLIKALLDRDAGVRATARYYLKDLDKADFYRSRLEDTPIALVGLGESDPEAKAEVLLYLKHPDVRYRRAAVRALSALKCDAEPLLEALQSEDRKTSKLARRALYRVPCADSILSAICRDSPHPHTRRNALCLLLSRGRIWHRLVFACEALLSDDRALNALALDKIHSVGPTLAPYAPPAEAWQRWRELEAKVSEKLPPHLKERIASQLKS